MAAFGISTADSAHIMTILRDTLYSDKVLAVLREYSANAWDSHRMAGKPDVPIKVVLPTHMSPTLVIEDFGVGLSHDDVFQVYTQYGASTKRNSNTAVGQLGIGSKSGFAYSDQFTIVSRHGGKQRTYVAVLDETEKGTINLLLEEDCGPETGVSIQIPIKPEDIGEFTQKARELFQYFQPRPDINTTLPALPESYRVLKNGIIDEGERGKGEWIALMGCIPYTIDLDQLVGDNIPGGSIGHHVRNLSGTVFCDIGELNISASRESLKYSTSTKKALVEKLNNIVDEYVRTALQAIDQADVVPWEKRIRAQTLARLHLPVPKDVRDWTKTTVKLVSDDDKKKLPKTFTLGHRQSTDTGVHVSRDTRLIILDDLRDKHGFQLSYRDEIVYPVEGKTPDEAEAELRKLVHEALLDGVPIVRMSTLPWTAPVKPGAKKKGPVDAKHKAKTFVLNAKSKHFHHPWSKAWSIQTITPQDTDVFVVLDNFKVNSGHNFYYLYQKDAELIEALKGVMPPIYGYKNTKKKPVTKDKCKGKEYHDWRRNYILSLITPGIQKKIDALEWANVIEMWPYRAKTSVADLDKELGSKHPIMELIHRQQKGEKAFRKLKSPAQNVITKLRKEVYNDTNISEATKARRELFKRYPLFLSLIHI